MTPSPAHCGRSGDPRLLVSLPPAWFPVTMFETPCTTHHPLPLVLDPGQAQLLTLPIWGGLWVTTVSSVQTSCPQPGLLSLQRGTWVEERLGSSPANPASRCPEDLRYLCLDPFSPLLQGLLAFFKIGLNL